MQELIQIWFQELFEGFYEVFDPIFLFITFFGQETFMIVLMAVIYLALDKELGTKIACSSLISCNINDTIKGLANIERPISDENIRYVDYDGLLVSTHMDSSSFPSGHSQNAGSMFGTIGFHYNKKKVWIYCIVAIMLIALSRLYLGVHWPLDISVGAILGLTIAFFTGNIYEKFKDKKFYVFLSIALIAGLLMIITHTESSLKTSGATIGTMLGLMFECKVVSFNEKRGKWYHKLLRVVVGLLIVFGIKEGLKPLLNLIGDYSIFGFIRYLIMTFVGIGLYPLLFKKFEDKVFKLDEINEEQTNQKEIKLPELKEKEDNNESSISIVKEDEQANITYEINEDNKNENKQ